ncbi:hypothetical protein JTE90_000657 [Oedothorax gibbosus]|uniref:Uncharacterized protein n=1 Tax=Oedothorax gibbosus TaxID=931172 RepID=A0AAV6VVN3_9ARAC|nr:hypothetical protein JTE90_000657 [Oedothorax gibbosus]
MEKQYKPDVPVRRLKTLSDATSESVGVLFRNLPDTNPKTGQSRNLSKFYCSRLAIFLSSNYTLTTTTK